MSEKESSSAKDTPEAEGEESKLSEEEIRDKMRRMTRDVLKTGRIDSDGLKDIGRAMTGGFGKAHAAADTAKEGFADAIHRLDAALVSAAESTHVALSALAAKGEQVSDNDIKEALEQLKQLQDAYLKVSARVAEVADGNIQRQLEELMEHSKELGTEASAAVSSMMSEFAGRLSATSGDAARTGLDLTREYGMRMAFLTSGVLAGVADALKEQATPKKSG